MNANVATCCCKEMLRENTKLPSHSLVTQTKLSQHCFKFPKEASAYLVPLLCLHSSVYRGGGHVKIAPKLFSVQFAFI